MWNICLRVFHRVTLNHELVELVMFVLREPEAFAGGGTYAHTLTLANVNYLRCALIQEHMQGASGLLCVLRKCIYLYERKATPKAES